MAEENGSAGAEGAAQGATAQGLRMQVLAQFVRDMSFENIVAQKGLTGSDLQPDIQVAVSLDARKRPAPTKYEVTTKYKVTSQNTANGDTLFLHHLGRDARRWLPGAERRYGGFRHDVSSGTRPPRAGATGRDGQLTH